MVHVLDLPHEVVNTIITIVVMSGDGARDRVSVSATCQVFNSLARRLDVLRVVNCQNMTLTGRCEPHHRIKGLFCRCVQAGNLGAGCMLAKAVLKGGPPLWRLLLENDLTKSSIKCATVLPLFERHYLAESLNSGSIADLPYFLFMSEDVPHLHESYRHLQHTRLLKSFVLVADPRELIAMCYILKEFMELFVGHDKYLESGIDDVIGRMCWHQSFADSLQTPNNLLSAATIGSCRAVVSMGFRRRRAEVIMALEKVFDFSSNQSPVMD